MAVERKYNDAAQHLVADAWWHLMHELTALFPRLAARLVDPHAERSLTRSSPPPASPRSRSHQPMLTCHVRAWRGVLSMATGVVVDVAGLRAVVQWSHDPPGVTRTHRVDALCWSARKGTDAGRDDADEGRPAREIDGPRLYPPGPVVGGMSSRSGSTVEGHPGGGGGCGGDETTGLGGVTVRRRLGLASVRASTRLHAG